MENGEEWGKFANFQKRLLFGKNLPILLLIVFDTEILDLMLQNETSEELHDGNRRYNVSKISNQDYLCKR